MTTTCPHCEALNREHSSECEREVTAILKQQSVWRSSSDQHGLARDANLDDVILTSRRRQMQIAVKRDKHNATDHAAKAVGMG
jgi:hypothetical protein